jgi:hypothetical protein
LFGPLGHRVGDHVGPRGNRRGKVGRAIGVLEVIDAHRHQAANLATTRRETGEAFARLAAARRRREVLQVDDQRVGTAGEHRLVRSGVGTRAEQPGAAQVGFATGECWRRCHGGAV